LLLRVILTAAPMMMLPDITFDEDDVAF